PAIVELRYNVEVAAVELIEPARIDVEPQQRLVGDRARYFFRPVDQREIRYAPQEPASDTRRAARAPGDLHRPIGRHADAKQPRPALDDLHQLLGGVEIEPHRDAEAVT